MVEQPESGVAPDVSAYIAGAQARGVAGVEHDPRWLSVLHEALGHQPILLVARSGENGASAVRGCLPLALVSSRLFGRFLVSLPYLNLAGAIGDDPATTLQLMDRAIALADELDVQYLELRHGEPMSHALINATRDEKVRMVLDLPANEEKLFAAVGAKVRNLVRKGDKSDLSLRWGGAELLDAFYDVFAVNMRDLGTPVYARRLFSCILEKFPGQAELAVVMHVDQPIAGALLIHDAAEGQKPRVTQVPSASSLRAFNHTSANMWMYHKLLLRAMERGSRQFDFGRSSVDSGTYKFKEQWGARPHPTVWQYHLRSGDMDAMRPGSAKNQRRVEMWKRLPVWVTRLVGPSIVKGIP